MRGLKPWLIASLHLSALEPSYLICDDVDLQIDQPGGMPHVEESFFLSAGFGLFVVRNYRTETGI